MKAENLFNFISNDKELWDSVVHHAHMLRSLVDRAAVQLAKENARWHDDPDADDHAEYHAPAEVQFPRDVRDEVVRDLIADRLNVENENERLREARDNS